MFLVPPAPPKTSKMAVLVVSVMKFRRGVKPKSMFCRKRTPGASRGQPAGIPGGIGCNPSGSQESPRPQAPGASLGAPGGILANLAVTFLLSDTVTWRNIKSQQSVQRRDTEIFFEGKGLMM